MKFRSTADNDIGKNSLNFGHDPDHDPNLKFRRGIFNFKSITCWSCGRWMRATENSSDVTELRFSV